MTESEYDMNYDKFVRMAASFSDLIEYWHPLKQEWVRGLMALSGNFLNFTNNRLESWN